jgi:uncharacterized LabA/DUF88 family protein
MQNHAFSQSGIALFIDIENMVGRCSTLGLPVLIQPICDKLKEIAPVLVRKAYGDIPRSMSGIGRGSEIVALRKELSKNLVEINDVPYLTLHKNSADAYIITAALTLAYENANITHFAFVSADRDYVPLYMKLKELGKYIVVVSVDEEQTSALIAEAADNLLYYEKIPPLLKAASLEPSPEAEPFASSLNEPDDGARLRREYAQLAVRATGVIQEEGRVASGALLISKMRQLRSDFTVARTGFDSFIEFLKYVESLGGIRISHSGAELSAELTALDAEGKSVSPAKGDAQTKDTITLYHETITSRLKIPLPSVERRLCVIQHMLQLIKDDAVFTGEIQMLDLAQAIVEKIQRQYPDQNIQATVYKILLSLFFSRSFRLGSEGKRGNPVITGLVYETDREYLDAVNRQFIMTVIKNVPGPVDVKALSLVVLGTDSPENVARCQQILEAAR